jgi:heme a synthase
MRPPRLGPILYFGFATALAIWCAWFITHLPWLQMREQVSMPLLLVIWIAGAIWSGLGRRPLDAAFVGAGAGILTALLGLAVLGSKIAEPAPGFEALRPDVMLIAAGFLTLGSAIGLFGALIGAAIGARPRDEASGYLWRFGLIAALAMAPLLLIGGLVTSTNSGMAVPDWPNTFGSNMFLYPLGPRAAPDVYLEHSHRLFGTFVGMATMVLMVWVLIADSRNWVRILAVLAFLLVCLQGLLGGARVLQGSTDLASDPSSWRAVHGILAQLVFGLVVAISAVLTPTFRSFAIRCRCGDALRDLPGESHLRCPQCHRINASPVRIGPVPTGRMLRFFTTGLLHALLLQLLLGALYRHARSTPSLWAHAGFSIIVVVFAIAAGFAAMNLANRYGGIGPILRQTGYWILAIITLQFLLGWATLGFGGHTLRPDTAGQALLRSAHQANGVLLLALTTIAFVWTRRLLWAEWKSDLARKSQPARAVPAAV